MNDHSNHKQDKKSKQEPDQQGHTGHEHDHGTLDNNGQQGHDGKQHHKRSEHASSHEHHKNQQHDQHEQPGQHDQHEQPGQHGKHEQPGKHGKHEQPGQHGKHDQHGQHGQHDQHGQHGQHDHASHHAMMIRDFRKRFWISLAITLPVLVLSPMIQEIFGYDLNFTYASYILFALSGFIYFYGGWPFTSGLVKELRVKQPGMMTLIAVAITVAFGYSSATTFGLEGKKFFWELATLIDIMLLGHWIEMKSVMGANKSLQKLVEMMPVDAHLLEEGSTRDVKVDELKKGDIVLVKPGEKVPVDGVVTEGESSINESMVTGESKPAKKGPDDKVIGGTINGNASLEIEVKETGDDAYLNKVITMVKEAQEKKSKTQHLADKIAFWLTLVALSVGAGTLATWLLLGKPFVFALERMASVMVITCPHALGLAVPLVVAISTTISARNGLLIRNRTAFENARKVSLLAFDKTGTLTTGTFGVRRFTSFSDSYNDKEILQLAGALETKSEHPIAQGIVQKLVDEDLEVSEAKNFNAITGKGVEAQVNEKKVMVVSPGYLEENNIEIPDGNENSARETAVYVLVDNELAGLIALSDEIRESSYEAVKTLKSNGLKLFMLTGDNEKVAQSVSEELGLDGYYAGILPDQKLDKIKDFKQAGEFVAMTGDGINDAPALATADVGIAVGSGTDVAAETADIILINSDPNDIASLIIFGKETYKKMIQNFIWATAYNVFAIPLAAGVLYSAGILINPALGAVLMSLSTVIVAVNAQLLKRKMKTS